MELTREYFDEQFKTVAKKQDLESFATKQDLDNFVSKEYLDQQLQNLATRDELKSLATKEDLKTLENKVDRIQTTLNGVKTFVYRHLVTREELKTKIESAVSDLATKGQTNQLINTVDAYIKDTRTYHQENKVLGQQLGTVKDWVTRTAPQIGVAYEP